MLHVDVGGGGVAPVVVFLLIEHFLVIVSFSSSPCDFCGCRSSSFPTFVAAVLFSRCSCSPSLHWF